MLCFTCLGTKHKFSSKASLITKKSLRVIQSINSHTGPLFKVSKILKSFDKTALENCIFISKSWKGLLPSIINWFKFFLSHSYDTRWLNLGYLKYPLTVLKPRVDIECL